MFELFKLTEHVKYNPGEGRIGIMLCTPLEPDAPPKNVLYISAFRHSWWFDIPEVIKPKKKWVDTSKLSTSLTPGYWDIIPQEYGFVVTGDTLRIRYGIQQGNESSNDSENSDCDKVFFIPWRHQHRVRYDFLNLDGTLHERVIKFDFESINSARNSVQKIKFAFNDMDGAENIATCHITEVEYRMGCGKFEWIGFFYKPTIYRTLNINFDKEARIYVGSRKARTLGTSIDMFDYETPREAFLRYSTSFGPRGFTNISKGIIA